MVAAELELRWNLVLERVTELQVRIDAHDRQRPAPTSVTPDDFASLTGDLKTVWADPAIDARLRKRIVRTLIHEVIADIEPEAGQIMLVLHWASGVHTELRLPATGADSATAPRWRSSEPFACWCASPVMI